ncbi:hypothetical protein HDU96_006834 [Phlyctochytrium bullatum]|nr:hypothetical protein HDU96_006834 [Phlyctochytrium bullatum]
MSSTADLLEEEGKRLGGSSTGLALPSRSELRLTTSTDQLLGENSQDTGERYLVGRRGSFIPLGPSLRDAADKITQKANEDRRKVLGSEYVQRVGLATVKVADGTTILEVDDPEQGYKVVTLENQRPSLTEDLRANIFGGSGAAEEKRPGSPAAPGATDYRQVPKAQPKAEEFSSESYVRQRIAVWNAHRILITRRKEEIMREKAKGLDLKIRERVVNNILRLEREISEVVLETQKVSLERGPLEQQFEHIRKEHDAALKLLQSLLVLYGKLSTVKSAMEQQALQYQNQSVRGSLGSRLMFGSTRLGGASMSSFMSLDRGSVQGSFLSVASSDHENANKTRKKSTTHSNATLSTKPSKERRKSSVHANR